ncbi:MAG: ActD-like protein [Myxococcota bacterium]|nr:ActD-like protein [Myxococcota bacterium]
MSTNHSVPDIILERLALGELSPEREEEVRKCLEQNPDQQERFDALITSNEEILSRYPAAVMGAEIRARAAKESVAAREWTLPRFAIPVLASAAVAVAALWILVPVSVERSIPHPAGVLDTVRSKGDTDPALFVYRKGQRKEQQLSNGARVRTGDVLQLKYAARGASNGVIFSVDGWGAVTLHFPTAPDKPTALNETGTHALAFSYELDDAPAFERFFFVTSTDSINVERVLASGRRLGASASGVLELPDNLSQSDFLLKKSDFE